MSAPQRAGSEHGPLSLKLTAGDAEMVVSWAEWALIEHPANDVLRAAIGRFREAFNDAAREALQVDPTDRDSWLTYVKSDKFKGDVEEAQRLMRAGDMDGLAAFASRNAPARARAAVRRARENRVGLPEVDSL